jgi:cytochrome c-type biogenesis protein
MQETLSRLLQDYLVSGNLTAYFVVFAAGVLVSFTPCVYPVIPITVGYLGGQAATKRLHGFLMSLIYVLGLAAVYTAMGAIAALTGRIFGQAAASPWAFFIVANICIFMALSMLDVFYIPMPRFLSRLGARKGRRGFLGAFFMGMVSGLVIGPCTAPVLGGLFAFVAAKQNLLFGVSLMFFFAMGMGVLFIVIGTFSTTLSSLPKAGKWMEKIKKIFGLILLGAGEYFLIQMGKALI